MPRVKKQSPNTQKWIENIGLNSSRIQANSGLGDEEDIALAIRWNHHQTAHGWACDA